MSNYQDFKKKGYVQTEIFSNDEVRQFRDLAFELVGSNPYSQLHPHQCIVEPRVLDYVFFNKLVKFLKDFFDSNFVIFPDVQIHYNLFGGGAKNKLFTGWHVDCRSEGVAEYLFSKEYKFAKVGVYFQDNDPEYGGGIDVVEGSHRWKWMLSDWISYYGNLYSNKAKIPFLSKSLQIRAGDCVFFDSRIQHRSTRAKTGHAGFEHVIEKKSEDEYIFLPKDKSKIVLYFNIATPTNVADYWSNSVKRAKSPVELVRDHFTYANNKVNFEMFQQYAKLTSVRTAMDYL